MTGPDGEPPREPLVTGKGVNSTVRETESGMVFTTHQRSDLRWFYRIAGVDSDKTYPTAGEAERGAMAALKAAAKAKPESWKWWMIIAVACAPIIYVLMFLVRLITNR